MNEQSGNLRIVTKHDSTIESHIDKHTHTILLYRVFDIKGYLTDSIKPDLYVTVFVDSSFTSSCNFCIFGKTLNKIKENKKIKKIGLFNKGA